jgi:hypothetical protein
MGPESTVRNEQKIERNIPEHRRERNRDNPVQDGHDYIGCQLKEKLHFRERGEHYT